MSGPRRITYKPGRIDECDRLHIDEYELSEVLLDVKGEMRRVIAIVIRGRNFKAMAQPLTARVGKISIRYLRIAPDERSVEGILLQEPEKGAYLEMGLGDIDRTRHPTPFDPKMIRRIE